MADCYKIKNWFFIGVALITFGCAKEHTAAPDTDKRPDNAVLFKNPIKASGTDPFVMRKDDYYYYMNSGPNYLILTRLQELIYLPNAYSKTIYVPEKGVPYSAHVSKAEIHFLSNKWYIYFSADNGLEQNKRIYAIENSAADPLTGEWIMKGKVADAGADFIATDGTVLEYNNQLYFVWSGFKENPTSPFIIEQYIYIAKMKDPYTLDGGRVMISAPDNSWDQSQHTTTVKDAAGKDVVVTYRYRMNQSPQVLKNAEGDVFLTYTAGTCVTDNTALGLLTLKSGGDPLNAADWTRSATPVFSTNVSGVFSPGHNSFFKSADGKEDWMIYDANSAPYPPGQGCGNTRSPRLQKITWKPGGIPDFGTPVNLADSLTRPSR